jgi:hypothetical protein
MAAGSGALCGASAASEPCGSVHSGWDESSVSKRRSRRDERGALQFAAVGSSDFWLCSFPGRAAGRAASVAFFGKYWLLVSLRGTQFLERMAITDNA